MFSQAAQKNKKFKEKLKRKKEHLIFKTFKRERTRKEQSLFIKTTFSWTQLTFQIEPQMATQYSKSHEKTTFFFMKNRPLFLRVQIPLQILRKQSSCLRTQMITLKTLTIQSHKNNNESIPHDKILMICFAANVRRNLQIRNKPLLISKTFILNNFYDQYVSIINQYVYFKSKINRLKYTLQKELL